jgi:hypothetical protein
MSLWDVMLSMLWFMLLVAWFWLMITIVTDIFRDDDMSGFGKAAWCIFVVLLPWIGVLTYLLARGRSMTERTGREAARNEQAFRQYVREAAASDDSSIAGELARLTELHEQGKISAADYEMAKSRVLGQSPVQAQTTTLQAERRQPSDLTG